MPRHAAAGEREGGKIGFIDVGYGRDQPNGSRVPPARRTTDQEVEIDALVGLQHVVDIELDVAAL